jgi:hypothetical protein
MSKTFFFPYRSDNLPATGVITAATIRYALNIQAAVPYVMLKSCIISGMAGKSMVSEKKTVKRVLLSIAKVNQAWRLTVTVFWLFPVSITNTYLIARIIFD